MAKGEIGALVSAGAVATALGGAYKFSEFVNKAKRLHDVGPANAVYVRLINRVRRDLDEVKRLLTVPEVKQALSTNRPKAEWVYGCIRDTRGALENITPHTERVAGDIDGGRRVGFRHRLRWLLDEKEKLENREREVQAAHASLCEAIGFLTALEPVDESRKVDRKVEIEIDREGPRMVEEREVWVDGRDGRDGRDRETRRVEERETWVETERAPHTHVEERETWVESERGPRRYGEEREAWVESERGPRRHVEEREAWVESERGPRRHVEERETWVDTDRAPRSHIQERESWVETEHRGPRRHVEERETWIDTERAPRSHAEGRGAFVRHHHKGPKRVEERELHIHRDPRHIEARYSEYGPGRHEESRYEERRYEDDRYAGRPSDVHVRERETYMPGPPSRSPQYGQYGEYAEYGAPQPSGASVYRRKFTGDPGFGDEEVHNPQPVPPMRNDREIWIEEKEDYRYDEYGNRLPERMLPGRLERTRYPRSRM
ncbi:uncharacterized protein BDR25DRAFT_339785 [Lindgomyces ingoldianus]|uniref:Uncharacterized protein n=1 Tax=Lindgomyces ingoldianus TaxID=673940 RepID=A0ACB6R9Q7_9PLEO|nr:uncharacterized protein BDR25DRAFT_339785 [Lindgomyces ingoldianus]KAF2475785.1 hypothetical protein BDR25DRAFT_339785 [Lindgomyces ingoldianus]